MLNNIELLQRKYCCGCSSCASACKLSCITMSFDSEGFLYPKLEVNNCINCGNCIESCPMFYLDSIIEKES